MEKDFVLRKEKKAETAKLDARHLHPVAVLGPASATTQQGRGCPPAALAAASSRALGSTPCGTTLTVAPGAIRATRFALAPRRLRRART